MRRRGRASADSRVEGVRLLVFLGSVGKGFRVGSAFRYLSPPITDVIDITRVF